MSEAIETPYVSPQEKLNSAIQDLNSASQQPPGKIDFRAETAKAIFVSTMKMSLDKFELISQEAVKTAAVMSVDAADILIAQLAKGRR